MFTFSSSKMDSTFNFHMNPPNVVHPEPTSSPSQSVRGRRTPLGTVGIGGFYAQGGGHSSGSSIHVQSDENSPSGSSMTRSTPTHTTVGSVPGTTGGKQKSRQGKSVRLNINARY